MQIFQLPLKNLPAFDIFDRLLQIALNYKLEDGEPSHRNSDPIELKNFSLLLAWPGILALELATLTGRGNYKKQLISLRDLLSEGAGYTEVRSFLDKLLIYKPIPEELLKELKIAKKDGDVHRITSANKKIRKFQPELFETLNLLFNQKTIVKKHSLHLYGLKLFLGNYYVMCLMIAKYLEKDTNEAYITSEDITSILNQCGIEEQPDIYNVSLFWFQAQSTIIYDAIKDFSKLIKKEKGIVVSPTTSIDVPSLQLSLRKLYLNNDKSFAFVEKYDASLEKNKIIKTKGFAHKVNPNNILGYDLWCLSSNKNFKGRKSSYRSFLFISDKKHSADTLENLLYQLYQVSLYSSGVMKSLIESWDDFIDNAEDIIGSNIVEFGDWFSSLIDDYEIRDQFFHFRSLSRIVGNLDTEIFHEDIKKTRELYKDAKSHHIPDNLSKKLLKADEELERILRNAVDHFTQKGKDYLLTEGDEYGCKDELFNYFDEYKGDFEYLKLLEREHVEKINFSIDQDSNAIRNNRREILPIFNKIFGGKYHKPSKLIKLLGLETGKEKYVQWAKPKE